MVNYITESKVKMGAQLFDIILKDIQSTVKNFNRLVTVGLLFIFFGHFYVIEPYFQYKKEEKVTAKELKNREIEMQKLSDQLTRLETAQKEVDAALKDIENRIRLFPDHLRETLPDIQMSMDVRKASSESSHEPIWIQQSPPPQPFRIIPPEIQTFEEGVKWYTNNWFSQIIKELKERVIEPALKIETTTETDFKNRLSSLSGNAIKEITKYVNNIDPDFWRSYSGGKVPVARGLYEVVDKSMQPIYKEIMRMMNTINTNITKQKESLSRSKDVIKEIQGRKSTLESRLKSIESPIGKIPVGLTDFIKLFPLLMVVQIVVMTIYLHNSKRLCDDLQEEYDKTISDAEREVLGYLTKLWYLTPYKGLINPLLLLILFTIIGLFIRSFFLIFWDKELFISITGREDVIVRFLFISAFLIGATVISGCIWFMQKRLIHKDTKGNKDK
jgi:hypothetical protein